MTSARALVFVATGNGEVAFVRLRAYVIAAVEEGLFEHMDIVFQGRGLTDAPTQSIRFEDRISRLEYGEYVQRASVFICHAGAGSIIDACAAGHQPILVPRIPEDGEVIDSHQVELARRLEPRGSVLVAWDQKSFLDCVRRAMVQGRRRNRPVGDRLARDIAMVCQALVS